MGLDIPLGSERAVSLFELVLWMPAGRGIGGGVVRLPLQEAFETPGMGFVEEVHAPRSSGSAPRCDTAESE